MEIYMKAGVKLKETTDDLYMYNDKPCALHKAINE